MRALVATGDRDTLVAMQDVAEPAPAPDQLVVDVQATSVNHGEVEWLAHAERGFCPGWDVAGRVVQAAADGSGPAEGERVAAFLGQGAWAQRVAIPSNRAATLPDTLDLKTAAGIPVVGLTALRALRVGGLALGKRVLVLGATGAIGRVAIQLAVRAGGRVAVLARTAKAGDVLPDYGAAEVFVGADTLEGVFDIVLDAVGGTSLAAALPRLAPSGVAVLYGDAAHEPTSFNTGDLFLAAPEARVHALRMDASRHSDRFGADIAQLARLVAKGDLRLDVNEPVSWTRAADVVTSTLVRRPSLKPVLAFD